MAFLFGALLGLVLGVGVVMAFARIENSRAEQRRQLVLEIRKCWVRTLLIGNQLLVFMLGASVRSAASRTSSVMADAQVVAVVGDRSSALRRAGQHVGRGGGLVGYRASASSRQQHDAHAQAATVSSFSKLSVQDLKTLIPTEAYPSWLKWLNQELVKIWPFVNEAASELIKSSVEPVFEQYKSFILASIHFSKLTLGTVAPQFTVGKLNCVIRMASLKSTLLCGVHVGGQQNFSGVQILDSDSAGITMELDMQWDGNPNIVLDIQTTLGISLPVQVKNIGFTGTLRLLFKPLVAELPCFGAVCVSLREKSKVDFTLKVVGGEMTAIPGISDAIEETIQGTIRDTIEDTLTWPNRIIVPIVPGDYSSDNRPAIFSDLELKPVGLLEVKLVEARDLKNKDLVGKSDPFAVLYIRPLSAKTKKSKTINNDLNPIWNEHYEFVVEDSSTQHLTVKIYDDEGLQPSEIIGCARVDLSDVTPGKVKDVWLELVKDLEIQRDKKPRGQYTLRQCVCAAMAVCDVCSKMPLDIVIVRSNSLTMLYDKNSPIPTCQLSLSHNDKCGPHLSGEYRYTLTIFVNFISLMPKLARKVHLELLYYPFEKQEGVSNPFAGQIQLTSLEKVLKTESNGYDVNQRKNVITRGVLSVTVISAEDIPAMDVMGKADPFVVLYLKKGETKKKTRVVTETLNPIWNQTFDFVVEDALHDLLIVEVWDHDTFGKDYIGRCILTLTRAILEGEFQDTYVLQGAKSGKLNLHFKWTAQPIYRDRDRDQ
ncbi:Extended synaptotagmin-1 [Triticum urartu]|uniref:Extended synaptotagmin-1 n=1 Tax=Triticum urartu TaxID=4572 RepID=M7ZP94_TRIUA|nr:Extended synaptotagmin-1 [Triticum urartu]